MTDLSEYEVRKAFNESLRENLTEFTKGKGSYYLQVYIGNKEYKDIIETSKQVAENLKKTNSTTEKLDKSMASVKDGFEDTVEKLEENSKKLDENTKSNKKSKEEWMAASRRLLEAAAKAAGGVKARIEYENDLNKTISESNIAYTDTAKELNLYANRMNLTIDEFAGLIKENSGEFNTLTRAFGDFSNVSVSWVKVSQSTGATQNEMNKALMSYTKIMTQNGEISNMTTDQFNKGAEEYIKETKLLAKALGVSTDAVLKQTEQAEKQWQLQVIMSDPQKAPLVQALQAAGHSTEMIMYELNGVMTEELAGQMAMNKSMSMVAQTFRQASERGELNNQTDIMNVNRGLSSNNEFITQYERDRAYRIANQNVALYSGDQKFAGWMGYGSNNMMQTIYNIGNAKTEEEIKNSNQAAAVSSAVNMEGQVKQLQNNTNAMFMLGKDIQSANTNIATLTAKMNEYTESLSQNTGWFTKSLSVLGTVGMVLAPVAQVAAGGLQLFSTGKGLLGAVGGAKAAGGAASAAGGIGLGTVALGVGALAAGGYAGYQLEEKTGIFSKVWDKLYFDDKREIDRKAREKYDLSKNPEKLKEIQARIRADQMKNATVQESVSQNVASSSTFTNKTRADWEERQRLEQEKIQQNSENNTTVVENRTVNNETPIVKIDGNEETQIKLSQMLSLMNDMNRQLSQMAFQIPNNNYSRV